MFSSFRYHQASTGSVAERLVCRQVDKHLLPGLFLLAIFVSMDGVSIGNARLVGLEADLHMKLHDFNISVAVYFIPCILIDYPANLLLQKSRPPIFLCTSAFLCGLITLGIASIQNFAGLVVCRLLLGVCETALQAGGIYLIASYYPGVALESRISPFLVCKLIGRSFAGLLAYASAHLDNVRGLSAWRWLFIIEGSLTILCAILCLSLVPEWPERATFLTREEKRLLLPKRTAHSGLTSGSDSNWWLFKRLIRSPQIILGTVIHFCCTMTAISSSVFLPTILRSLGWISFKAFFLSIPIFLTAAVVAITNGVLSDHFRIRYPFCAGPLCLVVTAFGILLAGQHVGVSVRYMACFLLSSGSFAGHSTALVWLSNNISGRKARGLALGMVGSIGNCGFILGSNIFLQREAPKFHTGFGICIALAAAAVLSATALLAYLQQTRKTWDNERMYPLLNATY